jgi:hypothetical protein
MRPDSRSARLCFPDSLGAGLGGAGLPSGPLPGAVHDLSAARIWRIIPRLAADGLIALADKACDGAGDPAGTL